MKEEAFYEDGKQEGPHRKYYEKGQLRGEAFYKDGKQEGPRRKYYENGNFYVVNINNLRISLILSRISI